MSEIIHAKINCDENSQNSSAHALNLNDLIKDKFGNYVIQRVLEVSNE
jgi:Pumilio-family RNA binding repeat